MRKGNSLVRRDETSRIRLSGMTLEVEVRELGGGGVEDEALAVARGPEGVRAVGVGRRGEGREVGVVKEADDEGGKLGADCTGLGAEETREEDREGGSGDGGAEVGVRRHRRCGCGEGGRGGAFLGWDEGSETSIQGHRTVGLQAKRDTRKWV